MTSATIWPSRRISRQDPDTRGRGLEAVRRNAPVDLNDLKQWHHWLLVRWAMFILFIFSGCDLTTNAPPHHPGPNPKATVMPTPALKPQVRQPPLDLLVSPQAATATFALG